MYWDEKDPNFKIDPETRVQTLEENGLTRDGTTVEWMPPKVTRITDYRLFYKLSEEEKEDQTPHVKIQFDDGKTEIISIEDVHFLDNEMEREFRILCHGPEAAHDQIEKKLNEASEALSEAEDLAERYGIPFYSGISRISQTYTPESYDSNFPDLERDFVDSVVGAYPSTEYSGWEHSAIC